jgi:flagellar motor switch protein FliN/FliY
MMRRPAAEEGEGACDRRGPGVNGSVTKPGPHSRYGVRGIGGVAVSTLDKVSLDIQVVLGTTIMPVHQVLRLGRGAIIELESFEDDEVDILANNLPVAKGTVVVSGNRIAVEVKELLARLADIR